MLDCDDGVMELGRCINGLSASTASGLELFLLVAAVCVFGWIGVGATIGRLHANSTRLLRQKIFQALLVQDVEWHDLQTVGGLSSKTHSMNLLCAESHGSFRILMVIDYSVFTGIPCSKIVDLLIFRR